MDDLFESESQALRRKMARELEEVVQTTMPFGRFAGRTLDQLPVEYLQYFQARGWPHGRLGELMRIVHQMKVDGSEGVFAAYRRASP